MVGPERREFVLFGSSVVQLSYKNEGWGAILATLYARKADIVLRGYSGWNSSRSLQSLSGYKIFLKNATPPPLELVIVYFGGNDSVHPHPTGFGSYVPLPEYIENMRKIAFHLKGLSETTRLIFLTAPPVNEEQIRATLSCSFDMIRTNEDGQRYSEALLEMCREMNLKVVDLWTAMQQVDNWSTVCFTDGVHFSSEGSKIVVKEIMDAGFARMDTFFERFPPPPPPQ